MTSVCSPIPRCMLTRHSHEKPPIASLPSEVRNLIYEYALQHWRLFELMLTTQPSGHRRLRQPGWADTPVNYRALATTCKKIRECLPMFFALNDFELQSIARQEMVPSMRPFRREIAS